MLFYTANRDPNDLKSESVFFTPKSLGQAKRHGHR